MRQAKDSEQLMRQIYEVLGREIPSADKFIVTGIHLEIDAVEGEPLAFRITEDLIPINNVEDE